MTTLEQAARQALKANRALREWINAVPKETVLPPMPGIDGDWLDSVDAALHQAFEQPKEEPYDQTALELCEVCGWKTLIPGDCCLNCERTAAQHKQDLDSHSVVAGLLFDFMDWFISRNERLGLPQLINAPIASAAINEFTKTQNLSPKSPSDDWVPVTQALLNAQHDWLYKPMWIALKSGVVAQGYYEWRQGRNPDRFITDVGDEWAFNAAYVMPITKPLPPSAK